MFEANLASGCGVIVVLEQSAQTLPAYNVLGGGSLGRIGDDWGQRQVADALDGASHRQSGRCNAPRIL